MRQLKKEILFIIFTLILSLVLTKSFAQTSSQIDTLSIRKKSSFAPHNYQKNPTILAKYLASNYTDEGSKVIAISYWIAKNIKYDYKAFVNRDIKTITTSQLLKKKKGVCIDYSNLFKEMCAAVGIKAEVVIGYTKDFDFMPNDTLYRDEHAWSIVFINGKWNLLDITWSSGYESTQNQYFYKLMLQLFKKPYNVKKCFKRAFNPKWLFVNPNTFIITHLPSLNFFQLLSEPIDIETFEKGDSAILEKIKKSNSTQNNNSKIESFYTANNLNKWKLYITFGLAYNTNNHLIKGNYCLRVADSLFNANYNLKSKIIEADDATLNQISLFCQTADSMFNKSSEDNSREYWHYFNRNNCWKNELKKTNNNFGNRFKSKIKANRNRRKLVDKINANNISHIKKANKLITKFSRAKIKNRSNDFLVKGPLKSQILLKQVDSIMNVSKQLSKLCDSLINAVSAKELSEIAKSEHLNNIKYSYCIKYLKRVVQWKHNYQPEVYESNALIEKKKLASMLGETDSINKNTDTTLFVIYRNQIKAFEHINQLATNTNIIISILKDAKDKAFYDQKEDQLLHIATMQFVEYLNSYSVISENFKLDEGIHINIESGNKYLKKSSKILRDEIVYEKLRHQHYAAYRKKILSTLNKRTKFYKNKAAEIDKIAIVSKSSR